MPSMNDVLGVIMGGCKGSRLHPMTKMRSKPAVPIARKYPLIDKDLDNELYFMRDGIVVIAKDTEISAGTRISPN